MVINIQGDEPFIQKSQIEELCRCFDDENTQIATLGMPFTEQQSLAALENPNSPKIVVDNNNYAMYFSRSVIPYLRNVPRENWLTAHQYLKHIGLYAYRALFLKRFSTLKRSPIERFESLEQLRAMWYGYKIAVTVLPENLPAGVDTQEDLERVRSAFLNR